MIVQRLREQNVRQTQ